MDTIDAMRMFVTVTEQGSFTAAGERLGLSKNLVSKAVAQLEARLGARLLNRTTRALSLTEAGQRYLGRCRELLQSFEALEDSVATGEAQLRGTLRMTAPATYGEIHLVSAAAEFSRLHPGVVIDLRLSDQFVDIVTEGFDLAIRIGELADSSLVARKLGTSEIWVVASRAFVARHGKLKKPADLANVDCVRDSNFRGGNVWRFKVGGKAQDVAVSGAILVNSARACRDVALACQAVAYCPDYVVRDDVQQGRLHRLLPHVKTIDLPIHVIYSQGKHLPARVRAFIDFMAERQEQ